MFEIGDEVRPIIEDPNLPLSLRTTKGVFTVAAVNEDGSQIEVTRRFPVLGSQENQVYNIKTGRWIPVGSKTSIRPAFYSNLYFKRVLNQE